jgi:60S ribosome subunit biogenesis protein NIP7
MRPLTEPETKTLFEKLATYCGKGISDLIADPAGGNDRNVFRVQVRSALCSLRPALCALLTAPRAPASTTCANPSPTSPPR